MNDPDFQIVGGDVLVKRAIYNSFSIGAFEANTFDNNVLIGNISAAQAYRAFLENSETISALVQAQPDSALANDTFVNLVRADELGLTKRHASDWYGGFAAFLNATLTTAGDVGFGFDFDASSNRISRIISFGDLDLADTIDIAGTTDIIATSGDDTITLTHRDGTIDENGRELLITGGADRIANTTGLTINGVLGTGGELRWISRRLLMLATVMYRSCR